MLEVITHYYKPVKDWLNANQGLESFAIFLFTLCIGWVSGVFTSLRRRPRFQVESIPGPTFSCTFPTGEMHGGHEVYRTAIAIYLNVSNVGSAPSSIKKVHVGYHWSITGFSLLWLRYGLGWFWLLHQTTALEDFQFAIGEDIKVYPFLLQRSKLSMTAVDTYLEVGKSANGVVYFEQEDSWGACMPRERIGKTFVAVSLEDVFGRKYRRKFSIPVITLPEARKYNPSFGSSLFALRRQRETSEHPSGTDV